MVKIAKVVFKKMAPVELDNLSRKTPQELLYAIEKLNIDIRELNELMYNGDDNLTLRTTGLYSWRTNICPVPNQSSLTTKLQSLRAILYITQKDLNKCHLESSKRRED